MGVAHRIGTVWAYALWAGGDVALASMREGQRS
jgi:hypothetical protein